MIVLLFSACALHELRAVPAGATADPPVDDGPHEDAQTEWWHVHADLRDIETGEPLHVFAKFLVQRTDLDRVSVVPIPAAVNPLHTAYVRIAAGDRAWTAERESFPDFFTAGFRGDGLDLYHGDWRIRRDAEELELRVTGGPNAVRLSLTPTRAPTLPGEGGRVELQPDAAHLWVQEDRMAVSGRWVDGGRVRSVEGTGFLKHQWGRLYNPTVDGLLSINADLPDGRSLAIAWLTDDAETGGAGSLAFLSSPDGRIEELRPGEIRVTPTRTWRSPRSHAQWPIAWGVEGDGLDLVVEAERADQELWVFPTPLWAGPARISGVVDGQEVDLLGFAEQAGVKKQPLRALYVSSPPPGDDPPAPPRVAGDDEQHGVQWVFTTGAEIETEEAE